MLPLAWLSPPAFTSSLVMLRCVFFTCVFSSPNRQLMLIPYLREG